MEQPKDSADDALKHSRAFPTDRGLCVSVRWLPVDTESSLCIVIVLVIDFLMGTECPFSFLLNSVFCFLNSMFVN